MILEEQIENYLKAEPTRKYTTRDIAVRFGRTRAVTSVLKKIRAGLIPQLHCVINGSRYEYLYMPEGCAVETKVVTFRELLEYGYLQEVNRLFFNPLGMSLALVDNGNPSLIVYDFRHTEQIVAFSPEVVSSPKFKKRIEYVEQKCIQRLKRKKADVTSPRNRSVYRS